MTSSRVKLILLGVFLLSLFIGTDFALAKEKIGIESCLELQKIGNHPSYPLDGDYFLKKDIDCKETSSWNDGLGFDPIDSFKGVFDGRGYVIANLFIDRSENEIGLFGVIEKEGEVFSLGLLDIEIKGEDYTGGLGGMIKGKVEEVFVTGEVKGRHLVGLLSGELLEEGEIRNSYARGSAEGVEIVGLISGEIWDGFIENTYALGEVKGGDNIGGLVGENLGSGEIKHSYFLGEIFSQGENVGVLLGYNEGDLINSFYYNEEELDCVGEGNSEECFMVSYKERFYDYDDPEIYSNWDFGSIWSDYYKGEDFPVLSWQIEEEIKTPSLSKKQNKVIPWYRNPLYQEESKEAFRDLKESLDNASKILSDMISLLEEEIERRG